jgi:uncharacterized protein
MTVPYIVLDSNVVISGFLFGGPPGRVLEYLLEGSVVCFTSLPLLDEIRDVLRRPKFGLSPEQSLAFVEELRDLCRIVQPEIRVREITEDPADNAVLECAAAARAGVIVSGDSHLLKLGRWRGVEILTPREFVGRMEK